MRPGLLIFIVAFFFLTSCNSGGMNGAPAADTMAASGSPFADTTPADGPDGENDYATMYLVIADTAQDYYTLQPKMYALGRQTGIGVDTMNRHYDKQKDNIVLADDDEDEMYRGEYFPRRDESCALSLEYYKGYSDASTDKNIALVSGMFYAQKSADSILAIVKQYEPKSFVLKAQVYESCMH